MKNTNTLIAEEIISLANRWEAIENVSYRTVHNDHGQADVAVTTKGREIGYALGFAATGFANSFRDFHGRAENLRREAEEVLAKGALWALCARGLYESEAAAILANRMPEQVALIIVNGLVGNLSKAEEVAAA